MTQPTPWKAFLLGWLIIGLTSCNQLEVHADYDLGLRFGQYQSFTMANPKSIEGDSSCIDEPLIFERIEKAVLEFLPERGLTEASEEAQLRVVIRFQRQRYVEALGDPFYSTTYGWGGRAHSFGTLATWHHVERQVGYIQIDFIDNESERMVWRGSGLTPMSMGISPRESSRRVRTLVQAILEQYPPDPES